MRGDIELHDSFIMAQGQWTIVKVGELKFLEIYLSECDVRIPLPSYADFAYVVDDYGFPEKS